MVVEIIEFECVCARVYGPCVDWGRALTSSENGYAVVGHVVKANTAYATMLSKHRPQRRQNGKSFHGLGNKFVNHYRQH